ncbi:Alpha-1,2-mannosyltransferase ALG9 [Psilocybe cubensis]|uniref:Alpha-1,2-mannosyltransferase ALG9 n=2 Tax=Psilocybe cubensis TaxID=181762 RepID=A0ACB8HDX8_PSICU|nr:Alpha-1,2-mannosyltransferase ALG9 [Psilocybe cubensis]KAH9486228.1 Alpha-1,2-mannosyltransferase ALG9 [Psilocybe cubensis]
MSSNVQELRFRGPTNSQQKPKPPPAPRHTGILQDQLRRAQRRPWAPSFSLAVRILFLIRISGAMYSNINDCDEVFNFWEPLHFLDQGYGFQTWELSPVYALRSWAYILLHALPPRIGNIIVAGDKRAAFFGVRIFLGAISVLVEAKLYRAITERINERVGRYFFFIMLFNAGMWNSATAFLPSTFAMYTTALAFSYACIPSSTGNKRRTLAATVIFALGGIVGWPFALALAIPFIFEELFVYGADTVTPENWNSWFAGRVIRLAGAGLTASLIFIPVIGIDSLAYGELAIVPWNIIRYNIFGGTERGPTLYGTEPWHFYIKNLFLNFNVLIFFALFSLPALVITYFVDRKRLGLTKPSPNQSSPFTLLGLRLAPLYVWLGILTLQPHKEERFMFPAYPLLCFNAAVCLYLARGWLETAYISWTKSPYQASQTLIFSRFTLSVVFLSSFLSLARILGQWFYYHSPMTVVFELQSAELPRLLNVTGLLPDYPEGMDEEERPRIDLSPIKEFDLTLCYGKDWYRFPGHFLVPNHIKIEFVKSEFDGMLPRHFEEKLPTDERESSAITELADRWWLRPETRFVPKDLNDLNKEDASHYVPVSECDYLVDLDFPQHPRTSALEPRYAVMSDTWERVSCHPFLDAENSFILTRMFWLPNSAWQASNEYGDFCLLKNIEKIHEKEVRIANRVKSGSVQK